MRSCCENTTNILVITMPTSREEIVAWLRDGANEISNTYRHMPKKTREAIGVQQIIDKMRNCAAQVENMRCEMCDRYVTGEDDEACTFNQIEYQGLGFGCFSHKPKEVNK